MWKRNAGLGLLVAVVGGLGGGCKKSAPAPALLPPPPVETVARVRWLGKQRLAADTNATSVMEIWNLPESQKLEAQTLDKLAVGLVAPNQLLASSNQLSVTGGPSPATNQPSLITNPAPLLSGPAGRLRPLLDDLLQRECFVEVRQATNLPGEMVLGIRLSEERARLWETNLAAVAEAVTGSRVAAAAGRTNGWTVPMTRHQLPLTRQVELARAGGWTVIGLGPPTNALVVETLALIQRDGSPFAPQAKEFWLHADFDLRRVASALLLGQGLPAELPRMIVAIDGDHQNVRTRGKLGFPKPLPADLGKWNIPTNLVYDPVSSFTAIRGIGSWLPSLKLWQDLGVGAPPGQVYFWAQAGLPFLSYCAAPMPGASNVVRQLAERLLQQGNAYLATNGLGRFARATNGNGVLWSTLPIMDPFLQAASTTGGDCVFLGTNPQTGTNHSVPPALYQQVLAVTNLVAYDWELTGPRIEQWLFTGQFLRMILHFAQMPPKSASVAWLQALESKLAICETAVARTRPNELSFIRGSSLGFTAVELHLLADWLESPRFPRGLHTLLAAPDPLSRPKTRPANSGAATNAVPPARPSPKP